MSQAFDDLKRLKEMRDAGEITDQEYAVVKAGILADIGLSQGPTSQGHRIEPVSPASTPLTPSVARITSPRRRWLPWVAGSIAVLALIGMLNRGEPGLGEADVDVLIGSAQLTPEERLFVEAYSASLGRASGLQGFEDAPGVDILYLSAVATARELILIFEGGIKDGSISNCLEFGLLLDSWEKTGVSQGIEDPIALLAAAARYLGDGTLVAVVEQCQ